MDNKLIGEIALITWAGMGLTIVKINDNFDKCTFYVSVPETSDHKNAHGEMMAGAQLAKRFKEVMCDMTGNVKAIEVRYKIRSGENWTEANKDAAEAAAKKSLYNGWVK